MRTALAGGLALLMVGLSACSLEEEGSSGEEGSDGNPEGEDAAPAEGNVREGIIPNNLGDNLHHELEIDAVERGPDSTALHLSLTNLGEEIGRVNYRGVDPILFDPVGGQVHWPLIEGEPTDAGSSETYGSHSEGENVPFFEGVRNEMRLYYPSLPDDVETVTFFGFGVGAMSGLEVTDVDEHRPDPGFTVDGADAEELESDPEPGSTLTRPVREPDDDAQAHVLDTTGYVAGGPATLTRSGEDETLSLDADVLFEFDESELTEDAGEVLADAGEAIQDNAATDAGTLEITGHTDDVGEDDYNQELSEQRAEAVAEELSPMLGEDLEFDVSGVGSSEPLVEEGGDDDEEARQENRRVEIRYQGTPASESADAENSEHTLAAAERHVAEPAEFSPLGEPVAGEEHDGFRLDVYPLRRDGAHVIAEFDITNTDEEKAMPDLGGDMALADGSGRSETVGGVQLVEPDEGLTRHPLVANYADEYTDLADHTFNVQPDQTHRLFAVYPAPSPDTDTVTINAGPFGEIPDVAIE